MSVRILTAAGLSFLCMAVATQASALEIKYGSCCPKTSINVVCNGTTKETTKQANKDKKLVNCTLNKTVPSGGMGHSWEPKLTSGKCKNVDIMSCTVTTDGSKTIVLPESTVYLLRYMSQNCSPSTDPNVWPAGAGLGPAELPCR